MKFVQWLVLGCAACLSLAASAQWQWVDNSGKTVFSDKAPPADVPEKNIVRRGNAPPPRPNPGIVLPTPENAAAAAPVAAPPAPAGAATGAKPGVDKELEEKIRKADEAEKAKKAAEAQKLAQAKSENCKRARESKATFDSGIRVARLNAQGEREIIDDSARAQEQQRLQSIIESDCR